MDYLRKQASRKRYESAEPEWEQIRDIGEVERPDIQIDIRAQTEADHPDARCIQRRLNSQLERIRVGNQNLAKRWETTALRTRYRELEYSLKMQRKRLALLTGLVNQ